jgi:hypothetical protein
VEDPGPMLKLLDFFDLLDDIVNSLLFGDRTRPSAMFSLLASVAIITRAYSPRSNRARFKMPWLMQVDVRLFVYTTN